MGDVFDRWRLNCGWNPWDNDTQMAAINSWVYTLDRDGVPHTAYTELYERVLQTRAKALREGKNLPPFGVDLLLAEWQGEWGYKKELRNREINSGRTLTTNAESVCRHCDGSGFRPVERNGYKGVDRCNHED